MKLNTLRRHFVEHLNGLLLANLGFLLIGCGSSSTGGDDSPPIPQSFSVCSGDLTNRRLSLAGHHDLVKICLDDLSDTAHIRISTRSLDGVVQDQEIDGAMKREIDADSRRYSLTVPVTKAHADSPEAAYLQYDITLRRKFVTRDEGILSLHFVGSLVLSQRNTGDVEVDTAETLDDLHFYSESPDKELHWGYEPPEGPDVWGLLRPEYELCQVGREQSPVNVLRADAVVQALPALNLHYKPAAVSLVNNGHTLQVNVPSGQSMTFADKEYELLQFHVHVPSEHLLDGSRAAIEVHMVHQAKDGALAVLAFLGQRAEDLKIEPDKNPLFDSILPEFPSEENQAVEFSSLFDPRSILPPDVTLGYYTYSGSLTTPPCSEGVTWIVLKDASVVANEKIETTTSLIGTENARRLTAAKEETLPLFDRMVLQTPE